MDKTILVIDNDDSIVEFLTVFFELKGFTVYAALDGDAGVDLAVRHRPAVILCDMRLGDMDGLEVLRRVRSRPELRETMVIMASASSAPADIVQARKLGADDYVLKPFDAEELLATVERHRGSAATGGTEPDGGHRRTTGSEE
jgi:DNA-binding response OmpR family regulator